MKLGEKICTWPDGSKRIVNLIKISNDKGYIGWFEHHPPISDSDDCVVRLDDEVPLSWLCDSNVEEKGEIILNYSKRY